MTEHTDLVPATVADIQTLQDEDTGGWDTEYMFSAGSKLSERQGHLPTGTWVKLLFVCIKGLYTQGTDLHLQATEV